jgi:hypothetical protein
MHLDSGLKNLRTRICWNTFIRGFSIYLPNWMYWWWLRRSSCHCEEKLGRRFQALNSSVLKLLKELELVNFGHNPSWHVAECVMMLADSAKITA